ncbi:BglG family transcription antiterminator [Oceanobacillus polygoni]|uniref:Mannitol operon transcriptional antiterminator n=1 Tax=Oceanobacillus polygoni TaxID=1235259 RepID=A0A9X0YRZ9_9BACI|nr:PRD domain-containing protein [Oceanobacillus polygoni]MBP2076139.1 mannitol operon transcriptional antiterminator [Oceanobacillus polygoni]
MVLNISSRERKIFEILLGNPDGITVKEIAKELEVSARTIHRDLKNTEEITNLYNLKLEKKSGVGLRLVGMEQDRKQLRQALTNVTVIDFTPEERQSIILATLLEMKEPIKLFTLSAELKVTEATISHDLDQLEKEIAAYRLIIIRKRGYGVEIAGEEANKRAALSDLISKHIDPFEFVTLIKDNIQKNAQDQFSAISNRLLGLVNPEHLIVIRQRVEQAREELPYELADSALIGLVVHLALAIERLQKGDTIQFDQAQLKQMEGTKEYRIAEKMIRDLESPLGMDIPDDEIGYITMHLMGAKLRFDSNYIHMYPDEDIVFLANQLIRSVSSHINVPLMNNKQLLNDLVAHLKPSIYRLKQGMTIKNPMIQEIKQDYDELFHMIATAVEDTFPNMEFPDDEIGYLVLHFAAALLNNEKAVDLQALVICSSGIGTSKMLATKLVQRIPEIKHVENASIFDLNKLDVEAYHVIVSTIPLKEFDHGYLLISPMLTQSEIHQVKKEIKKRKLTVRLNRKEQPVFTDSSNFIVRMEALQNYSRTTLNLLDSFRVYDVTDNLTMDSVLRLACKTLAEKKIIRNEEIVFKKLQLREQISGLGIPATSIALYHTRSNAIHKPTFSIYKLTYPLTIRGMDGNQMKMDTVIVMLAPEIIHQEVLEILSFLSSLIIQDQTSISLYESGDETRIKQYLSEQLEQFLHEKDLI